MTTDTQIQADVEELRKTVKDTAALYREVCTVLFFRYGITPSANKLYQYVRKGSMSAPAEALAKFWADLREKSRVRIEHPDLPDALKLAAGELVGNLWMQAQTAAQESLAIFRSEAETAVAAARAEKDAVSRELSAAHADLVKTREESVATADRVLQLERELAAEHAQNEGLTRQLSSAVRQQTALETALAEARRDFSSELEKLRRTLQRSEERYEAGQKRALLEIDRERSATGKLQKDLLQARQLQSDADKRHRDEIARLHQALGEVRQNLGASEGVLQEVRALSQQQAEELQSSRVNAAELAARYTQLRIELDAAESIKRNLEKQLSRHLEAISAPATPKPRKRRKTVDYGSP